MPTLSQVKRFEPEAITSLNPDGTLSSVKAVMRQDVGGDFAPYNDLVEIWRDYKDAKAEVRFFTLVAAVLTITNIMFIGALVLNKFL